MVFFPDYDTSLRHYFVINWFLFFTIPDYDTNKTVQCSSSFVYDKSRQRSLQHFIMFEELPEKSQNIVLPSGKNSKLSKIETNGKKRSKTKFQKMGFNLKWCGHGPSKTTREFLLNPFSLLRNLFINCSDRFLLNAVRWFNTILIDIWIAVILS